MRGCLLAACLLLGVPWLRAQEPQLPCDTCLPGVLNFARLDACLWRGAQPTAEGFRALKAAGARTVVSFRHDGDDTPLLKGTGLRYLRIPSRAWHLRDEDLAIFLKVAGNPANHPIFIHCAQGRDRTGYNAAAYRMLVQGWSAEAAIAEMKRFRFNRVWVLNPGDLRHLDLAVIRERVKALPEPVLAIVP